MKKSTWIKSLLVIAIVGLGLSSCFKKQTVTDKEAITFLEFALNQNADGVAKQAKDLGADLDYIIPFAPCGYTIDTTVYYKVNGAYNCDYTFVRHYELLCGTDTTIHSNGTNSGTYDNTKVKIVGSSDYQWVVTGVKANYSTYNFNGTSNGTGTLVTKGTFPKTYNVNWTLEHTNVSIQKYNRKINSGTGTFAITCKVLKGDTYPFTGTITYNGDGTATILLNGNTYSINLY